MKTGRDAKLEKEANALLKASAKPKGAREDREIERAMYEAGLLTLEELKFYDPVNDWDSKHSAYTLTTSDIDAIEPTLGAERDDGLERRRNRRREEKLPLLRHVDLESEDDWPSPPEKPAPKLGQLDKGGRKTCTSCGISKGLEFFSPYRRNADGLHSSCKTCRRQKAKESYVRKSDANGSN
ncbi:hypothetical protein [Mycolicibacterium farcinogenes]|uniref:Uncharacterized protein n=1 Tax=Mycolicibacterium farcinogenes TaxID=1802 RepID=A0ACD1FMP9_MYCFR|nr:hypothetical protein [Mycolicibacterium farcinogenes]QZH68316.1 hypothetical protein K6L26_12220 [Mycolicibacterium farcinogenes]